MSNKKITSLNINISPTNSDTFPIVNNGETKQMSLSGLTGFIIPNSITTTGGTYSSGTTIFTNTTGGTFSVTGYTYLTPSLQEVINVNKVADRVEFTYPVFSGQSFIYDGVRGVYITKAISANTTSGIYIYGNFSGYGTSNSSDIIKITSGGTIDTSFSGGTGFNNYPFTSVDMIQTSTGKLYLGGFFTTYNGVTNNYIIKLNPDGTKDTSFSAGTGFNDYTTCLGLTSDEKLFVGGRYASYQGVASSRFIKLNSDGTKDTSFNIGSGFNNIPTDVLVLTGDSLFVTGYFSTYNGSSAPRIVKLTSGGTIDTSFSAGTGFVLNTADSPIQMFKTSDNKLLVYGWFSSYNGTSANRIIRLNFDGTVDTSFNSGTGFNDNVNNGQLMLDGRYLITGSFTSYNGVNSNRTIILNSDGSIYKTFSILVQSFELPDGRIIGAGYELGDDYRKLCEIIDTYPVINKKLTFSETTGKAEYKIGGLDSTSSQELLPKRLIQQLILSGSSSSLTGATFSNNYLSLKNNSGTTLNVLIDNFTGLTVNGGLSVTGNTSSELVKIIQNGSGDAFVVQDQANGDTSHFVINASGNTAIGLTQPLGNDKLTVSGNTSIYGNLIVSTISATTYYNLPTTGTSPISVISGSSLFSTGLSNTGLNASGVTKSNFFGEQAGYQATTAYQSNFFGYRAGYLATAASNSNFLGQDAGYGATGASGSNFFGNQAGQNAKTASGSNFLGNQAGNGATNANNSNFFGQNAGENATSAYQSNFFGFSAGDGATNATYSNFLGNQAGYQATGVTQSNFLGLQAGQNATNATYSNFFGTNAGNGATTANNSNFFGASAGNGGKNAYYSNFIGYQAGNGATDANRSNFIGVNSGFNATGSTLSTFIGYQAGYNANGSTTPGSNNIIIGTNITLTAGTTNSVNIGGVLFGSGTYSTTAGNPSTGATATGKIGIGVVTPTANLDIAASTTASALMRLRVGSAPSAPNDGDVWLEANTLTGLKIRISGVTRTITIT